MAAPTVPFDADPAHRGRRALYTATTAALTALMLAAVLDAVTSVPVFGVDGRRTEAAGGGYHLSVLYPVVTRPALASPFEIEVARPGGFDGPVEVAVDGRYLELWDLNGIYPDPSAQRTVGDWVVWEIEPPAGDRFRVIFDGRIEPAAQSGRRGAVAVMDADRPVVEVDLTTRVMP